MSLNQWTSRYAARQITFKVFEHMSNLLSKTLLHFRHTRWRSIEDSRTRRLSLTFFISLRIYSFFKRRFFEQVFREWKTPNSIRLTKNIDTLQAVIKASVIQSMHKTNLFELQIFSCGRISINRSHERRWYGLPLELSRNHFSHFNLLLIEVNANCKRLLCYI